MTNSLKHMQTLTHLHETHHTHVQSLVHIHSHTRMQSQSHTLTIDLCTHTHAKNTYFLTFAHICAQLYKNCTYACIDFLQKPMYLNIQTHTNTVIHTRTNTHIHTLINIQNHI